MQALRGLSEGLQQTGECAHGDVVVAEEVARKHLCEHLEELLSKRRENTDTFTYRLSIRVSIQTLLSLWIHM